MSETANAANDPAERSPGSAAPDLAPEAIAEESADAVVRRTKDGWRVGGSDLPDLTSAMVLADLISAELSADEAASAAAAKTTAQAGSGPGGSGPGGKSRKQGRAKDAAASETKRLRATIGQLEHALTARVRVEQAIGVLAERHRIQPRQAFEQLRTAARNRGRRVIDIASDVVASATNPLLQLPDELSRPRSAGRRGRQTHGVLGSE